METEILFTSGVRGRKDMRPYARTNGSDPAARRNRPYIIVSKALAEIRRIPRTGKGAVVVGSEGFSAVAQKRRTHNVVAERLRSMTSRQWMAACPVVCTLGAARQWAALRRQSY